MKKNMMSVLTMIIICYTAVMHVSAVNPADFHAAFLPYMSKHDATYVMDIDNDGVPELIGLDEEYEGHYIYETVYILEDDGTVSQGSVYEEVYFDGGVDSTQYSAYYADEYGRIYHGTMLSTYFIEPGENGAEHGWYYDANLHCYMGKRVITVDASSNMHTFDSNYNSCSWEEYRDEESFYLDPDCYTYLYDGLYTLLPVFGAKMGEPSLCFPAKDPWSTWLTPAVITDNGLVHFDDCKPYIVNNRTMIPLRKCFELLGADVCWDGDTSTVTATRGNRTVVLQINHDVMYVDGEACYLDAPPVLTYDRTYVPLRAVSEALDVTVDWDGSNKVVYITE